MKIIYDDIIYSLQQSGGISVYWKNLEDNLVVDKRIVYDGAHKNIFYIQRENSVMSNASVLCSRYRNVRISENEHEPFVFHSSYYRFCKNQLATNITTVHDFTYEIFRKDWRSSIHKMQKKNAVMHSDGVICISENTKQDLLQLYPDFNGEIKVIYHGYDSSIFKNQNGERRSKDVLFVGSRIFYKNFLLTLQLLSSFPELRLVIIGGGELIPYEYKILNKYVQNRFVKLDYVSNEELATLYSTSFALAYPSDYEGFGLPVIEAQACGCPVICQPLSSVPEVSGDSCIYVDKNNIGFSKDSINRLFDESYYQSIQIAGLENVKRFSWQKACEETLTFYQDVYNKRIKR